MNKKIKSLQEKTKASTNLLEIEQIKVEHFIFSTERNIFFLQWLHSSIVSHSLVLQGKSGETIEKLNEFQKNMLKVYDELEKLKKEILKFQNYEGRVKSIICKNTEFKGKKNHECDSTLFIEKQFLIK